MLLLGNNLKLQRTQNWAVLTTRGASMGLRDEMLQRRQVKVTTAVGKSTHSLLYSIAHLPNKGLLSTYFALGIAPTAGDVDT